MEIQKMRRIIHKTVIISCSMILLMSMSACSTMKGLGQDIKSGGQSLENAAERHGG
jgi:predicted small secreted protein